MRGPTCQHGLLLTATSNVKQALQNNRCKKKVHKRKTELPNLNSITQNQLIINYPARFQSPHNKTHQSVKTPTLKASKTTEINDFCDILPKTEQNATRADPRHPHNPTPPLGQWLLLIIPPQQREFGGDESDDKEQPKQN